MPSSHHETASCTCGQVVFDVAGRKVGAILTCPWCKKEYRYLGGEVIRDLEPGEREAEEEERRQERKRHREEAEQKARASEKAKAPEPKAEEEESEEDDDADLETEEKDEDDPSVARVGLVAVTGPEEVFRFDAPDKDEAASDVSSRMKKHAAKRKRKRAVSDAPAEGRAAAGPKGQTSEIPGGAFRMIAFIVIFNAIFLVILNVVFHLQPDGRRTTPWGWMIPAWKVPWPELATLFLGHVCAFVAWAWNVYGLQKRLKAKAEADAAAAKEAKKNGESQRAKSAKEKGAAKADERAAKKAGAEDKKKESARDDEEGDEEEDEKSDKDEDDDDAVKPDAKPAGKADDDRKPDAAKEEPSRKDE